MNRTYDQDEAIHQCEQLLAIQALNDDTEYAKHKADRLIIALLKEVDLSRIATIFEKICNRQ